MSYNEQATNTNQSAFGTNAASDDFRQGGNTTQQPIGFGNQYDPTHVDAEAVDGGAYDQGSRTLSNTQDSHPLGTHRGMNKGSAGQYTDGNQDGFSSGGGQGTLSDTQGSLDPLGTQPGMNQGSAGKYTDGNQDGFSSGGGQGALSDTQGSLDPLGTHPGMNQGSAGEYAADNQDNFTSGGGQRMGDDVQTSGVNQSSAGPYASDLGGSTDQGQDSQRTSGLDNQLGQTRSQSDTWSNNATPGGYVKDQPGDFSSMDNQGSDSTGATGGKAGNSAENFDSSYGQSGQTDSTDPGFGGQTNKSSNAGPQNDQFGGETKKEQQSGKPKLEDKIVGNIEKLAGAVTRNQGLKERGQERKTGELGGTTSGY